MAPQHIDPEEAVKIHMDVKSKKSLAVHWGTFPLADEVIFCCFRLLKFKCIII